MTYYLAFVHAESGGFGFTCPDVPGFAAYSGANSFDEAVSEARAVLAGHVAALLDAGGDLPEPRKLSVLRNDRDLAEDWNEAMTTVMLPALVPIGRTKRVNITIDEADLALIDRAARERGVTRSAFVTAAAREKAET